MRSDTGTDSFLFGCFAVTVMVFALLGLGTTVHLIVGQIMEEEEDCADKEPEMEWVAAKRIKNIRGSWLDVPLGVNHCLIKDHSRFGDGHIVRWRVNGAWLVYIYDDHDKYKPYATFFFEDYEMREWPMCERVEKRGE